MFNTLKPAIILSAIALTLTACLGGGSSEPTKYYTIAVENISMVNTSEKFKVYATKESVKGYENPVDTYYVNNTGGNKFQIFGAIQDEVSGIYTIKLMDGTTELASESSLPLKNIDFSGLTSSAILTIEAKDNAGNVTKFPVQVKIDNEAPKGIHAIDASGKDIFFRIGDNFDSNPNEISSNKWDDKIDKDVGGKYSPTSYGNKQTVRLRGTMNDSGSGVSMIYYKVISHNTPLEQNEEYEEDGETKPSLLDQTTEFLKNYETQNNGYFRANKEDKKRVTYNSIDGKVYDSNGDLVVLHETDTMFNGFVETHGRTKQHRRCHIKFIK